MKKNKKKVEKEIMCDECCNNFISSELRPYRWNSTKLICLDCEIDLQIKDENESDEE